MAASGSLSRLVRLAVVFVLGLVLVGCDEAESPSTTPETRPANPSSDPSEENDGTPRPRSFDPQTVRVELEPVAEGFEAPLGVTHAGDGSGRLFVVEQTGTIRIIDDGKVLDEPFLEVGEAIVAGGEQGLLGLAF